MQCEARQFEECLILKGKVIISTEEACKKLAKAEMVMKKKKKKNKKRCHLQKKRAVSSEDEDNNSSVDHIEELDPLIVII